MLTTETQKLASALYAAALGKPEAESQLLIAAADQLIAQDIGRRRIGEKIDQLYRKVNS